MKKILLLFTFVCLTTISNAQVKVNQNAANSSINTSSAFMDASSSSIWNASVNQGKGFLFPRVNLVNYTAMSHAGPFNASNNPNYFDGLLVFNTATGIAPIGGDSVYPGYYYYRNTSTSANSGHWISFKGLQGVKGETGASGVAGGIGTDGKNTLVITSTEIAGVNCIAGGTKIEYGLDANNNGVLDVTEINATLTKYICNGVIGATGSQGPIGLTGSFGVSGSFGNTIYYNGTDWVAASNINNTGSRISVNNSGIAADASAILDVSSSTNGFLMPRMTSTQRTAIATPAIGLLIYQTDSPSGFYYYNGTGWQFLTTTSNGASTNQTLLYTSDGF